VPVFTVHDKAYVAFLQDAYAAWEEMEPRIPGDAFADCFNVQHRDSPPPQDIHGRLGFYTADGYVPITATSWEAIKQSAFVALTAQAAVTAGGFIGLRAMPSARASCHAACGGRLLLSQ
jgi:acetoin utilization deacetylase AcuC-like enzyme